MNNEYMLALTAALLHGSISMAMPQDLALTRTFAKGAVNRYDLDLLFNTSAGDVNLKLTLEQKVRGVNGDGTADIDNKIFDIKTFFNGTATEGDKKRPSTAEWTVKCNGQGAPIKSEALPKKFPLLNLVNSAFIYTILPAQKVSVGSSYTIKWTDPTDQTVLTGTTKVAENTDGLFRLSSQMTLQKADNSAPSNLNVTSWVRANDGVMVRSEGNSSNPQGPSGIGLKSMQFKLELQKP